jgi:hypothetical protein
MSGRATSASWPIAFRPLLCVVCMPLDLFSRSQRCATTNLEKHHPKKKKKKKKAPLFNLF